MGLSSEEIYVAEVVAAKISGILSMIGSGLIIRDVILRWRRRKERQFLPIVSRIVLSMSIANLFNSCFVHFAGTWMVPKGNAKVLDETFPIPLATGNDLTCKVQAIFWSLFSLAGGCTNGTLATAYWLLVCKEKKENELNKWKWQILLLWFPWLLGLVDSIVFAVGFGFHVHRDSWFCSSFLSEESPNSKWRNGMLAALAGVINILIIIMMIMLIKFVYTLEKKTDSYRRNGETRQNTIQVTRQGLWFILAYMVAMVPAVLTIVVNDLPGSYLIFVACTRPLQGGFNALVYFRPKYIAERQKMVSTSNARNSRLSSILVTLNMPLPRRSSAFSNNGSGQTMSTPQLLDQHVAENKEQHKSSIDLHNSNGDLLSDNENLA